MDEKENLYYKLGEIFDTYNKECSLIKKTHITKSKLDMVDNEYYITSAPEYKKENLNTFFNMTSSKLPVSRKDIVYIVEPDIAGSAVTLYYKKGKLAYALLRAPSIKKGYDITHLIKDIPSIVKRLEGTNKDCVIKGILSINKDDLFSINETNKLKGTLTYYTVKDVINLLHKNNDKLTKNIPYKFYPFDIIIKKKFYSQWNKIEYLEEIGYFGTGYSYTDYDTDCVRYINEIIRIKDDTQLLVDGVIIKVNNVEYQKMVDNPCARIKFDDIKAITKIESIRNEINPNGLLIPVGLTEPFYMGEELVDKINLFSYSYINNLDIKINDTVNVVNNNGVIFPTSVVKVYRGTDTSVPVKPDKCPYCKKKLVNYGLNGLKCPNEFCSERVRNKMIFFINNMDIKIPKVSLEKMIANKIINMPYDLYNLKEVEEYLYEEKFINKKDFEKLNKSLDKSFNKDKYIILYSLCIPGLKKECIEKLYYEFESVDKFNYKKNTFSEITGIKNEELLDIIIKYVKGEKFKYEYELMIKAGFKF